MRHPPLEVGVFKVPLVVPTDGDPEMVLLYCFCFLGDGIGGVFSSLRQRVQVESVLCSLPHCGLDEIHIILQERNVLNWMQKFFVEILI